LLLCFCACRLIFFLKELYNFTYRIFSRADTTRASVCQPVDFFCVMVRRAFNARNFHAIRPCAI
jgi:hypothetical protein